MDRFPTLLILEGYSLGMLNGKYISAYAMFKGGIKGGKYIDPWKNRPSTLGEAVHTAIENNYIIQAIVYIPGGWFSSDRELIYMQRVSE